MGENGKNEFEVSLEEFEKLEDISKRPRRKILEDVVERIKKYDAKHRAQKYKSVYHTVLDIRAHFLLEKSSSIIESLCV